MLGRVVPVVGSRNEIVLVADGIIRMRHRLESDREDFLEAGTHRVEFISSQLATGTYFYRLQVVDGIGNGYAATRAMTVIR